MTVHVLCVLNPSQHFLYSRLTSPLSKLPGPEISRWTELVYIYYWFSGKIPYYVHQLHEEYGKHLNVGAFFVGISLQIEC